MARVGREDQQLASSTQVRSRTGQGGRGAVQSRHRALARVHRRPGQLGALDLDPGTADRPRRPASKFVERSEVSEVGELTEDDLVGVRGAAPGHRCRLRRDRRPLGGCRGEHPGLPGRGHPASDGPRRLRLARALLHPRRRWPSTSRSTAGWPSPTSSPPANASGCAGARPRTATRCWSTSPELVQALLRRPHRQPAPRRGLPRAPARHHRAGQGLDVLHFPLAPHPLALPRHRARPGHLTPVAARHGLHVSVAETRKISSASASTSTGSSTSRPPYHSRSRARLIPARQPAASVGVRSSPPTT